MVLILSQDAVRPSSVSPFTGHHLPFIGFSFTENRYVLQVSLVIIMNSIIIICVFCLFDNGQRPHCTSPETYFSKSGEIQCVVT